MIRILSILALMLLFIGVHDADAQKRVALVIGNSAYEHAVTLANPKNDATDMTKKLNGFGFEVTSGFDLDLTSMRKTVRKFINSLDGADLALFYYAGHGVQVHGENYMAPINAKLANYNDLDFEMLPMELVMSAMERNTNVNLVFLDACRDNPLAKNLARSMGTRSGAVGKGLAKLGSGVGSLIAFATQPGNVALDGKGRNSPFTSALLRHLGTPGQDVTRDLIYVRRDVLEQTDGEQVPWDNSSLIDEVVLVPKAEEPNSVQITEPGTKALARPDNSIEQSYWDSIKGFDDKTYFEAYLQRWPNGTFADIAKLRVVSLQKAAAKQTEIASLEQPALETESEMSLPDYEQLTRNMQSELNRIGCSVGRVDGKWGAGSQRALKDFARRQEIGLASLEPDEQTLGRLKAITDRVCPLVCGRNQEKKNGQCVAIKQQKTIPKAKTPAKVDKPKTKVAGVERNSIGRTCKICTSTVGWRRAAKGYERMCMDDKGWSTARGLICK